MNDELAGGDRQVIGECLDALANGPFVHDWGFSTLCGCEREEMARLAAVWPDNEDSEVMKFAVNNALNNLTGYPHGKDDELARRVSAPLEEIEAVHRKWHRLKFSS